MALNLYRRHREACEAGRAFDSRSGEFEERKRDWKRCGCLIFASGTLGRKFSRRSLNTDDWAKARELAGEFEKADSWADRPAAPALPEPAAEKPRVTLEAASEAYIANREAAGLKPPTLRKYHTFGKQIREFADGLGYVMLDQFTSGTVAGSCRN